MHVYKHEASLNLIDRHFISQDCHRIKKFQTLRGICLNCDRSSYPRENSEPIITFVTHNAVTDFGEMQNEAGPFFSCRQKVSANRRGGEQVRKLSGVCPIFICPSSTTWTFRSEKVYGSPRGERCLKWGRGRSVFRCTGHAAGSVWVGKDYCRPFSSFWYRNLHLRLSGSLSTLLVLWIE